MLLRSPENTTKIFKFGTVENGTVASRPLLSITYQNQLPCQAIPNRPPLADKDFATTTSSIAVTVSVLANDHNVDPVNTFSAPSILGVPSHGSASVSGNNIIYTPTPGFNGKDTVRYRVCNNNSLCDTAIIEITVTNAAPNANADRYSFNSNTSQT